MQLTPKPTIRNRFLPLFLKCAYTQKCIVPRNTTENNHRWDQSVLTLLIVEFNIPYCASPIYQYTAALHADGMNAKETLLNLLLKIQNTYSIQVRNEYYNTSEWKQTKEAFREVSRPIDDAWMVT